MARILDAARLTPVGLHTAPPADPMAELCQSIVTDAAEAAQAIRDKAVQDASEPASAAPPLVPKAIKRKKWGKWIKGPCMDWRAILQVEYGDAGQDIIRHRIKNPRE